jgi:hypothetical protein
MSCECFIPRVIFLSSLILYIYISKLAKTPRAKTLPNKTKKKTPKKTSKEEVNTDDDIRDFNNNASIESANKLLDVFEGDKKSVYACLLNSCHILSIV